MIKAVCTWGDGPDVLLVLEGKRLMCYEAPSNYDKAAHGFVSYGSIDLTADEAIELASQLVMAAKYVKEIEQSLHR